MGMGPLLLFLLYNGWTAPNTHEGEGEAKGQPRALCKGKESVPQHPPLEFLGTL